jgi:hypothetical protein
MGSDTPAPQEPVKTLPIKNKPTCNDGIARANVLWLVRGSAIEKSQKKLDILHKMW